MNNSWSESEKETLRLLYGKKSTKEISEIMGRSERSIIEKSLELELREKRRLWTKDDENKLRQLSPKLHYKEIAKIIGISENTLLLKAKKLEITLIKSRNNWTKNEDAKLKKYWGKVPIEFIMKTLGKSKNSVKGRVTALKLGRARDVTNNELTLAAVFELLKVRPKNIITTWQKRGLKLKYKKVTDKTKYYCVDFDKLLLFMEQNQDLWNSVNLEINALGEEPEWLWQKRKYDVNHILPCQHSNWTPWEIAILRDLLNHHYSYEDIEKQLKNRSRNAIKKKAWEMGLGYKIKKYWTGEEFKLVIKNYPFMPNKDLSKLIPGRSIRAIERQASNARVLKMTNKSKLEKE